MDWQAFKTTHPLQDCPDTYTCGDQPAICPLESFGLIKISGDDAGVFLQNITSNNFDGVEDDKTVTAAVCNPKGRMLATFSAVRHNGAYYLAMPRELIDKTVKYLGMFVLAAKVTLEDVSDAMPGIGIVCATEKLSGPGEDSLTIDFPDRLYPRAQIYLQPEALESLWEQLTARGYTPMTSQVWHQCSIRCGFVQVLAATDGKLVPQMANLDLLGGISFSKGCYPGQEIVARMHYLGKLKKRTYIFSTSDNALAAGDEICREDSSDPCGTVADICLGDARSYGLATLNIADRDTKLCTSSGATLMIEPCPYEIADNSYDPEKSD